MATTLVLATGSNIKSPPPPFFPWHVSWAGEIWIEGAWLLLLCAQGDGVSVECVIERRNLKKKYM